MTEDRDWGNSACTAPDEAACRATPGCVDGERDPSQDRCRYAEHQRQLVGARIAANRGPLFPMNGLLVEVVEAGTVITVHEDWQTLTVREGTAVRKGDTLFVTQSVWDALVASTQIREFSR